SQDEFRSAAGQQNGDAAGFPVFDGVADRFLGDFIELANGFSRERWRLAGHPETTSDIKGLPDIGGHLLKLQTEIFAEGIERTETASQVVRVINHLVEQMLGVSRFRN